jgi:hypothetical protein
MVTMVVVAIAVVLASLRMGVAVVGGSEVATGSVFVTEVLLDDPLIFAAVAAGSSNTRITSSVARIIIIPGFCLPWPVNPWCDEYENMISS